MIDPTPDPARGAEVFALDRAHVFHSWSAQGALNAAGRRRRPRAATSGTTTATATSTSPASWSTSTSATSTPRSSPRSRSRRPSSPPSRPQHANEARGEAAKRIAELAPDGLDKVFFTNGGADAHRERDPDGPAAHRPRQGAHASTARYHGNTGAAITATGDPRRWPNEYADRPRALLRPVPVPHAVLVDHRGAGVRARAGRTSSRSSRSRAPATIAAILLESVVGTAGVLIPPPGYLAGVRALCDRHGIVFIADEVMAGFGRTGKWFAFDALRRDARPDHLRQGLELRLRPGRRRHHQRRDRGDVRRAGLPRRPHLLRPPARLRVDRRVDRRDEGGGHRRERRARSARRCSAPACASSPSGTR